MLYEVIMSYVRYMLQPFNFSFPIIIPGDEYKHGAPDNANLCIEFIHFQHPVLKLSQSTFFPCSEKTSFKPIKKAKISLVKQQFLVTYTVGQAVQTGLL